MLSLSWKLSRLIKKKTFFFFIRVPHPQRWGHCRRLVNFRIMIVVIPPSLASQGETSLFHACLYFLGCHIYMQVSPLVYSNSLTSRMRSPSVYLDKNMQNIKCGGIQKRKSLRNSCLWLFWSFFFGFVLFSSPPPPAAMTTTTTPTPPTDVA